MIEPILAKIRERKRAERGGLDWCERPGHPYRKIGTPCEECLVLVQMFWWLWEEHASKRTC